MARIMKNSEIEWLGSIPDSWKVVRNKTCFTCTKEIVGSNSKETQLLSLTTRGIIKKDANVSGGKLPETFDTYQLVKENDIVMCLFDLDVSAVFSGKSNYDGMISPAYKVLKCNEHINPEYVEMWFSFIFDGRKFSHYAKNLRYTLNFNEFADLPILVPPITEQKSIATFLNQQCAAIDSAVEKTRKSIEEYKQLKQAVITEAVTKGVRDNHVMKESCNEWIGRYPIIWNEIKIKWLLNERKERSENGKEEPLSMSQKLGLIPTKDMDRIPNIASSFVGAKLAYKGDLVFNKLKAHLGVFAVSQYDGLVSPDYAVYYTTGLSNAKYLEYLFKTPQYISEFKKKSSGVGAGLTRLYTNDLYSIYCAIPPLEEQNEIVDYLDRKCEELDVLMAKKELYLTELEAYKKSLIYEYVTGKKEVPEAIQVKEAIDYLYFPAKYNAKSPRFAQAILMSKILDDNCDNMGRVKLEKTLYTIENNIGFDFDTEYVRDVAGPFDSSIYDCEGIISRKNKWFVIDESGRGVSYNATDKKDIYKKYYKKYFSEYDAEIQRIIDMFSNYTTDKAEIIATLFAAWNDAIIDNKIFTDEDIVDDVLNNWHDKKKRFSKDIWINAMVEMRENNLVPKGYGKHTVKKGER